MASKSEDVGKPGDPSPRYPSETPEEHVVRLHRELKRQQALVTKRNQTIRVLKKKLWAFEHPEPSDITRWTIDQIVQHLPKWVPFYRKERSQHGKAI